MSRRQPIKIDFWAILSRAVEEGTGYGLSRYNKHASEPLAPEAAESIAEHVEREVLNALAEVVQLD